MIIAIIFVLIQGPEPTQHPREEGTVIPNATDSLPGAQGVVDVGPEEFEANLGNAFVIQTHTPYEGEIEGTDLLAERWSDMESYADMLPEDRSQLLLVYCRTARMSRTSARQIEALGYENILHLEGGMVAWEASGREIIFR